mgnify:CR=1 FL=1
MPWSSGLPGRSTSLRRMPKMAPDARMQRPEGGILLEVPGVDHLASQQRLIGVRAELREVLEHYDRNFRLGLTEREKAELVEYLKSI